MKQIHHQEKEQFRKLFEQENVDRISDRFRVLEAFLATENHLTAEELGNVLRQNQLHFDNRQYCLYLKIDY